MKKMRWDKIHKEYNSITRFGGAVLVLLMLMSASGAVPFAYITNSGSNTVSVIDTATNKITAMVNLESPHFPFEVAITPDGKKVYFTNPIDNTVLIIHTANINNSINIVSVGVHPRGVDVAPDGKKVYVANCGDNTVSVIDANTNKVTATVNVGTNPFGVAVNPAGTKVYVVNHGSNSISIIDTGTNKITATINIGKKPSGVAITPDGTKYT